MSQAPNAPPPHAPPNHWPARPLFQTHFRCRRRPPPHRVRATNTAPFHEKRSGERPTPRPHVRRTRPYHTAVVHTATHTTTTRVTISLLYYQMCILLSSRRVADVSDDAPRPITHCPRALACFSPTATPLLPGRRHELSNCGRWHRGRAGTDSSRRWSVLATDGLCQCDASRQLGPRVSVKLRGPPCPPTRFGTAVWSEARS